MMLMRLQRALARAGVTSRRKAEDLIRAGRVRVDGAVATIGMSVDPLRQRVTVDGRAVRAAGPVTWLALNKPVGYVVSRGDPEGRQTVYGLLPNVPGLTYVGRLDVMTSGLLLFTTDGAAAHRLMHPRFAVPRTYWLRVHGRGNRRSRTRPRRHRDDVPPDAALSTDAPRGGRGLEANRRGDPGRRRAGYRGVEGGRHRLALARPAPAAPQRTDCRARRPVVRARRAGGDPQSGHGARARAGAVPGGHRHRPARRWDARSYHSDAGTPHLRPARATAHADAGFGCAGDPGAVGRIESPDRRHDGAVDRRGGRRADGRKTSQCRVPARRVAGRCGSEAGRDRARQRRHDRGAGRRGRQ